MKKTIRLYDNSIMADFIVKAVIIDGLNWPLRALLESLDSKELGETEWWRRMAILQNAAARTGDGILLRALDNKKESRWGRVFDAPEIITQNNLPPLSVEECVKRWFQEFTEEKQQEILKHAMCSFLDVTDETGMKKLFSKKQDWIAVYMVLRDRLGIYIKKNEFHNYTAKIIPDNCPSDLKITSSTMTNFSKTSFDGPYYKKKENQNPFHNKCEMLWTIIRSIYYSQKFTND